MGDRRGGHSCTAGEEGVRRWRRRDHWCVTETILSIVQITWQWQWTTARRWEESGVTEKIRDIIVVWDSDQAVIVTPHLICIIKSSASMDRQVRAYGSVAIHAASALLIINNYETITQAAIALRSATTMTVPRLRGTTSHNRTLSRGATRRKLHISAAGKKSLLYDPRIIESNLQIESAVCHASRNTA